MTRTEGVEECNDSQIVRDPEDGLADRARNEEDDTTALYFAVSTIFAIGSDNRVRASRLKGTSLDGGSSGNLILRYIVDKLNIRIFSVRGNIIETADGSRSPITEAL